MFPAMEDYFRHYSVYKQNELKKNFLLHNSFFFFAIVSLQLTSLF